MTFSFGETSNGGIFDRRYFPWWTLLIHTCSSSMRMNREKGREGGRESGLEPTRSVRKMEIVVERIRLNEDRGFSSDGKKRLCLETRWRAVTCGMTQQ